MSWNYRIGTKFHAYSESLAKKLGRKGERTFSIIECYYDEELQPDSYGESSLSNWEDMEDLKGTHQLMAGAFKEPILDLDNFPKVYKAKKP